MVLTEEVAGLVKHEASPFEARGVLYDSAVHDVCFGKLLQGLLRIESARIVRSLDDNPVFLYLDLICLGGKVLFLDILDPVNVLLVECLSCHFRGLRSRDYRDAC